MNTNETKELSPRQASTTGPCVDAADIAALVDSVRTLLKAWSAIEGGAQKAALSEFLSPSELKDLTGGVRSGKQVAWLKEQGVAHRLVGTRIIVSRVHVRSWLEGKPVLPRYGINFDAIR